jgi:membrane protein DedA with SNARE-associated domain
VSVCPSLTGAAVTIVGALGEFVAGTMSYALGRSYGADIEAHWYIARYVLPGNVQKVILKPKQFGFNAPTGY